ncbi:putative transposase [Salinibacter ruber]|nr:putative transposase [Salinibacter ruber]
MSEGAVSQWMNKAREGGKEALKRSSRPGRPPKLSEKKRTEELPSLLEEGPEHFGFRGDVWTRKRVREVIKEEFGVEYDVSQVGRILDQIGWSRQKPDHRSDRRDEQAIENWKEEEWPRIKKSRDRGPGFDVCR